MPLNRSEIDCAVSVVHFSACPASAPGLSTCSGHGACVAELSGSSVCECFSEMGYVGDVCNVCAPGFVEQVSPEGGLLCNRMFSPTVFAAPPASPYLMGKFRKDWAVPVGIPILCLILISICCCYMRWRFVQRRKEWVARMEEKQRLKEAQFDDGATFAAQTVARSVRSVKTHNTRITRNSKRGIRTGSEWR